MEKLNVEEMIFLEENKYDKNLFKYFILSEYSYEFVDRAIKLPYEVAINEIVKYDLGYITEELLLINNLSKKCNLSNDNVIKRIQEVRKIKKYKDSLLKLELK